ncbi:MAG TPA: transglycosylase SLT domain-containing protein [Patescibacteria group bacterium]|nr:transglycosylase SLT domain-containing protein [Patescibacteria group bacterium]
MFPLATRAITLEKCYEECNERVAQSGWESNMIEAAREECYNTCRKFQTDGTLQSMASLQEGLNKLIDTATVDVELKKTGESITFTPNVPIGSFSGEMIVDEWLLAKYFQAWWSFILGSIGILAAVIIMWAGFKWITSRGNQSSISDAKDRIWSAIIGLLLAFFAYTIMAIINPQLTIIKLPPLTTVDVNVTYHLQGSHGTINQYSGSTSGQPSKPCVNANGPIIDYSNVEAVNPGVTFSNSQNHWFEKYGQQYENVDANMLRAISAQESGGGQNRGPSSAGAIGMMQFMPATAIEVAQANNITLSNGQAITEQNVGRLDYDDEASIELAAAFISMNNNKDSNLGLADVFAGYNGSYADQAYAGHALSASRDCEGVRAYRCCVNAGGLTETQGYVQNTLSYYNYYTQ